MVNAISRQLTTKSLYESDDSIKIASVNNSEELAQLGGNQTSSNKSAGFDTYIQMNQEKETDEELQNAIATTTYGPFSGTTVSYFDRAVGNTISYNGVNIKCDYEHKALCIGDMSKGQDIFSVSLSDGYMLKVNRKNMDDIGKVITMFSPIDQKRIVDAILIDKQIKKAQYDMDEEQMKIGLTDSQE